MACFEEEVCVMSEIPPWVEESKRRVRVRTAALDQETRNWQRAVYLGHLGSRGAAMVFKALSTAVLIGGVISAVVYSGWLHDHTALSNGQITGIVIAIVVSTLLFASMAAFFGYVLSMLVDIENNTRESAFVDRHGHLAPPPRSRGLPIL